MSNTSATGGPLGPADIPAPLEDQELDGFLRQLVAGITGLAAAMVRPLWPAAPADQPTPDQDWATMGVTRTVRDTFGVVEHRADDQGADILTRHETLDLSCNFYGPNSGAVAARLADGLLVAQNREALFRASMGVVAVSEAQLHLPQADDQWVKRYDITVTFRREVRRVYPVLNLLSADGTIQTDRGLSPTFLVSET